MAKKKKKAVAAVRSLEDDSTMRTEKDFENENNNLKIKEGLTPIRLLSGHYSDGYAHWVELEDENGAKHVVRVVCGGDPDSGKGFAPNDCKLCAYAAELYKQAKSTGDEAPKKKGNRIRAKYSATFIAALGEMVVEARKNPKTGKKQKVRVPDFEDANIGKLNLTQKQYVDLINLREKEEYPQISSGEDLTKYDIVADKAKRDGSNAATIVWKPVKKSTDPPEVEDLDALIEEFDIESDYEIDYEEIDRVYEALTNEVSDDEELEDEDLDLEEEEEDEEEFDDEEVDDDDEEEDSEEDDEEEDDSEFEDDEFDDEEEDDDEDDPFDDEEDDEEDPFDEEEEEKPPVKKKSSKGSSKKPAPKKAATAKRGRGRPKGSTNKK